MKSETKIAEENIKTKNKVFYILVSILMLVSTIYLASAYTPTYELCFDENGRGIECYSLNAVFSDYYGFNGEVFFWNRTLTFEEAEEIGKELFQDLCFIKGRGIDCAQWK